MPGGLLNLVAIGNQNVILTGNPSKTFFKTTYQKYTNFGLQKFRIDVQGQRILNMTTPSYFKFKIPRYGDLLMDTYLVVTLPTIWSPVVPPLFCNSDTGLNTNTTWKPYEFKWIKNLGSQMISRVTFSVGGQIIQEFTGDYMQNMVERDFSNTKKDLYYKMTGNTSDLNEPAECNGRINQYPTALYTDNLLGPDPSIRAKTIYIPLNVWFTLASTMAFPLVALQYNELVIDVEIRPVKELYVIRNVIGEGDYYKHPNYTNTYEQFYRFIQPPPTISVEQNAYTDRRTNWNADIHLLSTYAFLTDDEVRLFASQSQTYLIKEVYKYTFQNNFGSSRVSLDTLGMVINWMWYFQRSDADLRNEWSNYSNWPYNYQPYNVVDPADGGPIYTLTNGTQVRPFRFAWSCTNQLPCDTDINNCENSVYPSANPDGSVTDILVTPLYQPQNTKEIMTTWGFLLDGKYRENIFDVGVWDYVEKYTRTSGNAPDGLYCYNFCLNNDPYSFQPSGAMNLSKFNSVEFEFTTTAPPIDGSAQVLTVCDGLGNIIGVNKDSWRIFEYSYDLTVLEERYNVLTFMSGNAGLMFSR